jgi:2-keto-4-pentenoate hydratase/2-oxohepta-3-ene-1,7-dioic acid hydratase in catechol pathway
MGAMFRLINVGGRAALEHEGAWFDLAALSGDPYMADSMVAVGRHRELHTFAGLCGPARAGGAVSDAELGPPVPRPRQVFGIGLNFRDPTGAPGPQMPRAPLTFTKFPSCIAGPGAVVPLSGSMVDWAVELVVVIGDEASQVSVGEAWTVVAGLTLGQDITDRAVQLADSPPQFSMGKSFANYGPIGPAVVSRDAFADPDDVGMWCEVAGERVQEGRTRDLLFPVPALIAYLSSICRLYPGDLIFTGTPPDVEFGRGRFLSPGEVVESGGEVIGRLRNACVAGSGPLSV